MSEKDLTREERRSKMNVALSDADMANVTGGAGGDQPNPKFKIGDRFQYPPYILDGYVKAIYGYYGSMVGWVYECHMLDKDGWYDDREYEFNMFPY